MRQSQLFTKTRKEAPKDEVSKNAQLLIRAGFVHKEMAGVYTYLPLGLRVLNNIMGIIREEMNAIGGQEMLLTTLQDPDIWKKSGRWSDDVIDVWFKTRLANDVEIGLGNTHEEAITNLMRPFIQSYKHLPAYAYQFQTKFRNELRAKSGILRSREFIMKDLYSFSRNQEEMDVFYEQCKGAYFRVFERAGLGDRTFLTFASGGAFSKYSHEFQTICDAGEDISHVDRSKRLAVNREVYNDEVLQDLGLKREEMEECKTIEVGNIFKLGTRFSDALDLKYKDENGESKSVVMGSYGIGPGRLMGTIVECLSDERGIVWPEEVAPFKVHLLSLGQDEEAEKVYRELTEAGIEVLFDDRETGAGAKFADSDLMGIPHRVVVSGKSLAAGGAEVKKRTEDASEIVALDGLVERFGK